MIFGFFTQVQVCNLNPFFIWL